ALTLCCCRRALQEQRFQLLDRYYPDVLVLFLRRRPVRGLRLFLSFYNYPLSLLPLVRVTMVIIVILLVPLLPLIRLLRQERREELEGDTRLLQVLRPRPPLLHRQHVG